MPAPPAILSVSKGTQLVTEARALDVAELRSLKNSKRHALAVLFIQAQLQKALDDVAEIFIKVMRKLESYAKGRLQKYQLENADVLEGPVGQFRDVLQILQDEAVPERNRLPKIREALGDPAAALVQCNEHIAYAGHFDLPFMLVPYRNQRSLLFQCLDVLPLQSSSQDRAVLVALAWLQGFRNAHREYLLLTESDLASLPVDWLPEKWERAVFPHGRDSRMLHRRFFELGVFSQIMRELNSGDLYAVGSDRFDDYRVHQVSDEQFRRELPRYCGIVGLPTEGKAFAKDLRDKLHAALDETDANFPANDSIEFVNDELIIHKPGKEPEPPNRTLIDQAITASMPQVSILDLLTETEQWLDLHKLFGPLSGFDAKLDDPRKRFITTLFCYGCNLGPSQTARSVKGAHPQTDRLAEPETCHGGTARQGEREGDQRVQPVRIAEILGERQARVGRRHQVGACTSRICCPSITCATADTAGSATTTSPTCTSPCSATSSRAAFMKPSIFSMG
ncbi:hypothetical protein OKW50_008177 [Paraburkholderia youngii]